MECHCHTYRLRRNRELILDFLDSLRSCFLCSAAKKTIKNDSIWHKFCIFTLETAAYVIHLMNTRQMQDFSYGWLKKWTHRIKTTENFDIHWDNMNSHRVLMLFSFEFEHTIWLAICLQCCPCVHLVNCQTDTRMLLFIAMTKSAFHFSKKQKQLNTICVISNYLFTLTLDFLETVILKRKCLKFVYFTVKKCWALANASFSLTANR